MPGTFFEGEDLETVAANAEAEGISEAKVNDDGSITYKMSKAKHKEMMTELKKSIDTSKTELVGNEDFPSVKGLEISKDYSRYTLQVDREAFENSFDVFVTLSVGMLGMYYQAFDGKNMDDMHVEIELEDAESGEVFQTIIYPEVLEEMEE